MVLWAIDERKTARPRNLYSFCGGFDCVCLFMENEMISKSLPNSPWIRARHFNLLWLEELGSQITQ